MIEKIKNLGVLVDVSRDGVLAVDSFKKLVDKLFLMGYNFIELYSEDIYKVKEEPDLGYFRGAYSLEELQEMDEYASSKNMELIPCIQTLAHFTSLSATENKRDMFDLEDILLVDSPRTYEFIENIIKTCRQAFKSNKINIGMDEAWHLGGGQYLSSHPTVNRSEIFLKHLQKVSEIAKKYGYECQMWSDMFFNLLNEKPDDLENIKKNIPANVTLSMWEYNNTNYDFYDKKIKLHKELTNKVMFAGAAWVWKGFVPLNSFSISTLEPSVKSCLENDIDTYIVTMWGDDGNETSKFTVLPALFMASRFANNNFNKEEIKKEFKDLFGIDFDTFMLLDIPNNVYKQGELRKDNFVPGKMIFYSDVLLGRVDYLLDKYDFIDYKKYASILKDASKTTGEFKKYYLEESLYCKYLEHKAYLGFNLRKLYRAKDKKGMKKLLKEFDYSIKYLKQFKKVFMTRWLEENKGFGSEIHDIRIGGLIERIKSCKLRVKEYLKTGKEIKEFDEDSQNLWFDDTFFPNYFRDMISSSRI